YKLLEDYPEIIDGYSELLEKLDLLVNKKYEIYRLGVKLLSSEDIFNINVLINKGKEIHKKTLNLCNSFIKKYILKIKKIVGGNCKIINNIWDKLHNVLIKPFANVNYGYALTVHKGQGSGFGSVFIDLDDIIKNENIDEC